MKIGDGVPVNIAGQEVARAVIKELADGTVTLEFPATRVVMAVRTEIAPEITGPVDTTGTSVVIEDAERESSAAAEPNEQNASAEVAPPYLQNVEPLVVDDTPTSTAVVVESAEVEQPAPVGESSE